MSLHFEIIIILPRYIFLKMYVALRYFIIGFIVATILNLLVYSQFSNNSSSSTSNKLQQLQKELRENIENDIIDCLEDDVLLDSKFPSHCVKSTFLKK